MNEDKILKKIDDGIQEAPIDVLDKLKSSKIDKLAIFDSSTQQKVKKFPVYKMVAMAAVFLFALFGYRYQYVTADSLVYLDVNPSFEISINRMGQVVEVEGVNADAQAVIESISFDSKNIDTVVEVLTRKLVEMNYIRPDQNMIMVSVYNKDEDKRTEQSDTIEKVIKIELEKDAIAPLVLSQKLTEKSSKDDHPGVSEGKFQFISAILSMDESLNQEDLETMSVGELIRTAKQVNFSLDNYFDENEVEALKELLFPDDDDDDNDDSDDNQSGTRITLEAARRIALNRVNGTIVEEESDDDDYEFEIHLNNTIYEIEVNAYTGQIVKYEAEPLSDDDSDDDDDDDSNDNQSGTRITLEAARRIALDRVNGTIVEEESDDDEYEFEIHLDGTKYDIEVNAHTGEIIKYESESLSDDDSDDDDDDVDTTTSASPVGDDDWDDDDDSDDEDDSDDDDDDRDDNQSGSRITLEAARQIALSRVNGTIVEEESDDDEYEFEIHLNGTKYDIEVNAYTGEIVKFESESIEDDDDEDDD